MFKMIVTSLLCLSLGTAKDIYTHGAHYSISYCGQSHTPADVNVENSAELNALTEITVIESAYATEESDREIYNISAMGISFMVPPRSCSVQACLESDQPSQVKEKPLTAIEAPQKLPKAPAASRVTRKSMLKEFNDSIIFTTVN
ncbi:hypothetical protein [Candidatus Odyssella thessalonicensis]|uniref:hypothetical protein n=1 Tax=Candidatus Odyssella thessalonicensis TaxID=84647 RepID=UPI000225AEAB|nr:hypothetical protein [Candidatus Odyssella thessalonicensis]